MANKVKTLHAAIELALVDQPNQTASTTTISNEIKRQQLWTRPQDGKFPKAFQIRLRARKPEYAHLFTMPDDKTVRLVKQKPDQSQIALSIVEKAIGGKLKG